jgi:hypothetical protein
LNALLEIVLDLEVIAAPRFKCQALALRLQDQGDLAPGFRIP